MSYTVPNQSFTKGYSLEGMDAYVILHHGNSQYKPLAGAVSQLFSVISIPVFAVYSAYKFSAQLSRDEGVIIVVILYEKGLYSWESVN